MPAFPALRAEVLPLASLPTAAGHDGLDDDDRSVDDRTVDDSEGDGRNVDDCDHDDFDQCDFEPGVHEVWDPGCADDDEEPEPEAGDFWVERDDVLDALHAGRGKRTVAEHLGWSR